MFPSTRNGSETTVPLAERGTKGGVNFWDRQRFRDPSPVLSFNLVAHLHRLTERFPELFTARLVNFVPLSYLSRPRSTPRYIYIYLFFFPFLLLSTPFFFRTRNVLTREKNPRYVPRNPKLSFEAFKRIERVSFSRP